MSTDISQIEELKAAESLMALMKEYTKRLEKIASECEKLQSEIGASEENPKAKSRNANWFRTKHESLHNQVSNFENPILNLIRHASQIIEHSGFDDVHQLSLKLALTDLEVALAKAQQYTDAIWN